MHTGEADTGTKLVWIHIEGVVLLTFVPLYVR